MSSPHVLMLNSKTRFNAGNTIVLTNLMNFVAADETCVGMRREDHSYDFDLPEAVTLNVQNDKCDLEWTTDVSITTTYSPLTGH